MYGLTHTAADQFNEILLSLEKEAKLGKCSACGKNAEIDGEKCASCGGGTKTAQLGKRSSCGDSTKGSTEKCEACGGKSKTAWKMNPEEARKAVSSSAESLADAIKKFEKRPKSSGPVSSLLKKVGAKSYLGYKWSDKKGDWTPASDQEVVQARALGKKYNGPQIITQAFLHDGRVKVGEWNGVPEIISGSNGKATTCPHGDSQTGNPSGAVDRILSKKISISDLNKDLDEVPGEVRTQNPVIKQDGKNLPAITSGGDKAEKIAAAKWRTILQEGGPLADRLIESGAKIKSPNRMKMRIRMEKATPIKPEPGVIDYLQRVGPRERGELVPNLRTIAKRHPEDFATERSMAPLQREMEDNLARFEASQGVSMRPIIKVQSLRDQVEKLASQGTLRTYGLWQR